MKTMSGRPVRHVCDWAVERGVELASFEQALGVERARLDGPDERVALPRFYDALELVVERVGGDEALGLQVPQGWGIELFGVLGYLIYTSETMGAAIERILEFKELWSDGEEMWVERSGGKASLFWRVLGPERLATRVLADMALADIVLGSGELMGRALPLEAVRLPYAEPEDTSVYEAIVGGAPLVFGAPWLCVTIEAEALGWEMPSGDEMLNAYFAEQARARQRMRSAPRVSERVRAYLWVELVGGAPSLADVARVMGMSTRTLQRSLKADGVTFAGLLEQVRHALAFEHLGSGVSVAELSWLLGFSEPRALHRAFKRWTGATPAAVRAQLMKERTGGAG